MELSATEWLLIPIGLVVGTYGTLVGAGGGFVLVPVLLLLYPAARPATITAISLAVVFLNALVGSIAYARERRIDFRTGMVFAPATVPGAIIGAIVVGYIPRSLFNAIFGVLLFGLAGLVLFGPRYKATPSTDAKPHMTRRVVVDARGARYEYAFYQWKGILLSIVVGFVSSLLGIGGGIIHVPAMVLMLDFPTHIATATSYFILVIMSFAGTGVHVATGELAIGSGVRRSLLLAVGVIPGALLGAWLSQRIHGDWIIRMLGVTLVLVAIRLLYGAFVGA